MRQAINESDFHNAFCAFDRENQFSREGRTALFVWLVECRLLTLDVIALCCEFTEYENLAEFHENYTDTERAGWGQGNVEVTYPDLDTIAEYTAVIPVGAEGFIIMDF